MAGDRWKRARSLVCCPAAWEHATRYVWNPPWRSTAMKSRRRSIFSKPGWNASRSWARATFWASQAFAHRRGPPKRKLVGLEMIERGIARDGYKVCSLEGEADRLRHQRLPIALSEKEHRAWPMYRWTGSRRARNGGRGTRNLVKAKVVPTPFYRRPKTVRKACLTFAVQAYTSTDGTSSK